MSHIDDQDQEQPSDRASGTFDLENDGVPSAERGSGTAGLPPSEDVPPETVETIEQERAARLDPENRPPDAEVDNTERTFDAEAGKFTDNPEYDESDRPYNADSEA